ncbi:MAG TPA: DUF885 domain-containing protein [Anaerolineae bacterium]|nr:DUF885 domain-containing protein [Anaerolineae bacterium]
MPDHSSPALPALLADEWEFRMREDPLFATQCGDHRYDDRLPTISEADADRRLAQLRAFRVRAQAIDGAALSDADRLNQAIFARYLADEIAEIEFRAYRLPLAKAGGFHSTFTELPDFAPFNTPLDYENYIARLQAFPTYVAGQIEVMRAGLREGHLPPRAILSGVDESLRSLSVDDATRSVFFKPFELFPKTIGEADQRRLAAAGRAAIANSIVPGYRALLDFVTGEYLPAARADVAASSLPNGQAFYAHRVRYFTTLDITPQRVHEIGLAEVQRIRAEMEAVMHTAGFQGDFKEFIDFLRTDPRFYVETPAALMKEVALVLKKIDGELPRLFQTLPRAPYGIKPVPDHIAPYTTTAYYFPLAGDGSRAGFYYVNTYDLKSRPLYEIEALSLHEAVPGHHLQIALQQEIADLPNFRRFGWVTAFGEGWALYAERLGLEMGFYQDPYSDFGRLTYEMWRACRLVVDTGLHSLGWTRQQAIDYMAANTASTLLNLANEVDRYIAWPGQALAYKLGELKIRELRAQAEQQLGSRFDVREFHDIVLRDGALPLAVLEAKVKRWLAPGEWANHQ